MKTERNNGGSGKRFVAYFRVSTQKQGDSGLGLEAQQKAVADFVRNGNGETVAHFVEIESGKRSDRPKLAEAIALCQKHGYTLCVAKLDRLARNLHFITTLQASKVDFVAVDNATATPFVIHILCAVAEAEAVAISTRTRQALEAAKARGMTLGNPHLAEAREKANAVRSERATERHVKLLAIVNEIKAKTGLSKLAELAEALNLRGIKTARGHLWTAGHVHHVVNSAVA